MSNYRTRSTPTLKAVRERAEKMDATFRQIRCGYTRTVTIEAPHGYKFDGVHEIIDEVSTGPHDTADLMSRMDYLTPCIDHNDGFCEWCDG